MGRPQKLQQSLLGLGRLVRHFWPHLRKEKGLATASLLALLAEVALRLLEPWPLKFIFDRVISSSAVSSASGSRTLDALDPVALLTLAALAVVVLAGMRALTAYASTVGFALVGNRVLSQVRSELYGHLQRLSLSFHTQARGGDLTVRVISDVGLLKDVVVTAVLPLSANVLILIGMLGVMFWMNKELALLAIAVLPLFWLRTVRLSRRIQEASRDQRRREGAMAATVAESIGAIRLVQTLSLEGAFSQAFSAQNKKSLKEGAKVKRLQASLERTVDVLIAISTGLVLWYGARLVLSAVLTPGDLLVFLTYLKNAFKPVRDFAKYTGRLAKASAAGERVLDLLDREPEIRNLPGARRAPPFRGDVRFDEVSFGYQGGRGPLVLENIDFQVLPGQQVAVVGRSGIGKSTLTSLLLRLYDPQQGRVLIDGHDIREYTLESLRAQISAVLQDTLLFAATIRENIAWGAPGITAAEVQAAARLANAHEFILSLPDGYETTLGERGVTLSSGQRQRIAIARAAVRRSPILILDEPTTGLDEVNERAVVAALRRLAEGRTTFLITHDLPLAAQADLILYLESGRVVESGSHLHLMTQGGRYSVLYRMQAAARRSGVREHDWRADALIA